jgi:hypothetical protein
MTGPLERVLELVAAGRLTAEEAAPILEALERNDTAADTAGSGAGDGPAAEAATGTDAGRSARYARVEVRESGRRVVDLRVPISLGRFALARVPGLSSQQIAEVEAAVVSGARGPILDVEDRDGDGVRIILE